MLVISRTINESISIGKDIEVRILRLSQRRVTIGIEAPASLAIHRTETALPEAEEKPSSPWSEAKVLVVEDTPVHALFIQRALAKQGLKNVTRTSSGEDALGFIKIVLNHPDLTPSLVLLDLGLPGVSGFEVLERIRSDLGPAIPVVILSVSDRPDDYKKALSLGANAFVSKGESYDEFSSQVARIIRFWCAAAYCLR